MKFIYILLSFDSGCDLLLDKIKLFSNNLPKTTCSRQYKRWTTRRAVTAATVPNAMVMNSHAKTIFQNQKSRWMSHQKLPRTTQMLIRIASKAVTLDPKLNSMIKVPRLASSTKRIERNKNSDYVLSAKRVKIS